MATMKEKAHYNKTHYCRCQTKAIATMYRKMSQEKKDIMKEMGFGALAHVPEMNVSNTLLIELLDRFDEERGCLKTLHGRIYITPRKVASALSITNGGNLFLEKVDYNKLNPADKECAGYECRRGGEPEKIQEDFCCLYTKVLLAPHNGKTEQAKDNAAEKRKRALVMIREKRSKKRNDGAQSTNIAPDQFDSLQTQNEFSQTINTSESTVKYFRKKKIFPRKTLKTPPVTTPDSDIQIVEFQQQTRSQPLEVPPLALSLPSSVQEELMKDDFIYVPPQEETQQTSNNDCPQEAEKQGVTVSLTSSIIEDLFKDDYVYEVSNEDPAKEQQQQAQEPPVQQQSEQEAPVNVIPLEQQQQPCEEPTAQQSKQEAPVDVCPPEPKKQGITGYLTSSVIEEFFKDADVYQVSDEGQSQEPAVAWQSEKETLILSSFDREREDERPSFSLGISPLASQPTQPSQESVSELKILVEAVVDAGVTAALKFAEGTSSEKILPAAQVVSIHSMILNEIKTKRYQEQIYIVPMDVVNFMLETHGVKYTDMMTNKAYKFDIEQYAHHYQFLDKRKLASHPFLFVPICNGRHWWLWITDVNKKKFYVLDPINKKPEDIPDSRKELNKFVDLIISHMRVYAGVKPLMEDGLGEEAEYIQLNGQCTNYDCGIFVMKWLETINPQKIKSGKRYKYKAWTQKDIDDFRYQYGPNLLLHEMNKIRDQVISESEAIRLTKPSAFLSSPYCKYTSGDLDSK
ncbi:uncharacterized protein DS421_18g613270 [Arachis hypogaea]|nr:uncharacterized protein DS421_18g613270 [Arachis hypogaea]